MSFLTNNQLTNLTKMQDDKKIKDENYNREYKFFENNECELMGLNLIKCIGNHLEQNKSIVSEQFSLQVPKKHYINLVNCEKRKEIKEIVQYMKKNNVIVNFDGYVSMVGYEINGNLDSGHINVRSM